MDTNEIEPGSEAFPVFYAQGFAQVKIIVPAMPLEISDKGRGEYGVLSPDPESEAVTAL